MIENTQGFLDDGRPHPTSQRSSLNMESAKIDVELEHIWDEENQVWVPVTECVVEVTGVTCKLEG